MPNRSLRPCNSPGCPELVSSGRCEKHRKQVNIDYNRTRRNRDTEKFYNSALWQRVRQQKRNMNPLCEQCEQDGKVVPVAHVHHRIPIEKGGARTHLDNLISLCETCHRRLHVFGKDKE